MASLDEEGNDNGDTELEYLSLIREIRDKNEELYLKIKNLPKKSKCARKYEESNIKNSTISFLKKGDLKRVYLTNSLLDNKELTFFDAVKYFKCNPDTDSQRLNEEFYQLLSVNKEAFSKNTEEKRYSDSSKSGKNKEISQIIEGLKTYPMFSESEEKKLKKIIEIFEVGKVSKIVVKEILNECKKVYETKNFHKLLEAFYESIPDEYKGITQRKVNNSLGEIEVLLSEYLIGE